MPLLRAATRWWMRMPGGASANGFYVKSILFNTQFSSTNYSGQIDKDSIYDSVLLKCTFSERNKRFEFGDIWAFHNKTFNWVSSRPSGKTTFWCCSMQTTSYHNIFFFQFSSTIKLKKTFFWANQIDVVDCWCENWTLKEVKLKWRWSENGILITKVTRREQKGKVKKKSFHNFENEEETAVNHFFRASVKKSRQNLFANAIWKRDQSAKAGRRFFFWRLHECNVHVSIGQDENVSAGMLFRKIQSHILPEPRSDAKVHDESVGKFDEWMSTAICCSTVWVWVDFRNWLFRLWTRFSFLSGTFH